MTAENVAPLTIRIVDMLNACIEACIDGKKGYAEAAAETRDPALQGLFEKYSMQRADFAHTLKALLERHSGLAEHIGTWKGLIHRGFLDARTVFEGRTDAVILGECERGELSAIKTYDHVLERTPPEMMPPDVRATLVEQERAIKTAYEDITNQDVMRRRAETVHETAR